MDETQLPSQASTPSATLNVTSGSATVEQDLPDSATLRTANLANEQAAAVMNQNAAEAGELAADSGWEYTLLRDNDREDDAGEVLGAVRDAADARHFLDLFRESFQAFRQSAEYGKLRLGEQAKWQPTLRDANGRLIGQLNPVLLNPTLPGLTGTPVVQIILPNRDYRQAVASRLKPDRQQALEKGQPVAFLERYTTRHDDIMVQSLMKMMTPTTADQQQVVLRAMTEYRQVQADTKPEDVVGLRQSFGRIIEQTLQVTGFRRDTLIDKMMEVNRLQRVTYHPDVNSLGRQPIHWSNIPLTYKGVTLHPVQLKNLLLGNTVEVAGLRDERRPGLYRASVQFNVLANKPEESSKQETLKTDNKAEFTYHQRAVNQRDFDPPGQVAKATRLREDRPAKHSDGPVPRSTFRPGR